MILLKAGVVLFAGKTVWSTPEHFECITVKGAIKIDSFPFFLFLAYSAATVIITWSYSMQKSSQMVY